MASCIDTLAEEHNLAANVELHSGTKSETGIPEFDALDDYTPEFAGQVLLHRTNAELKPGDIVLPSDQISSETHEQLNGGRGFRSQSSPHSYSGSSYDQKLAHAGTRDYKEYGDNLYIVEPLEGDTVKWGENFGVATGRDHAYALRDKTQRSPLYLILLVKRLQVPIRTLESSIMKL